MDYGSLMIMTVIGGFVAGFSLDVSSPYKLVLGLVGIGMVALASKKIGELNCEVKE